MTLTASFRPGAPTTPQLTPGWVYQFLNAEEASTATLMSFYKQARLELESFIRTGDLTVSDSVFYRQLLAEVEAQGTKLNEQGAQWTSDTIPEAYRSAWSLSSSNVVPAGALEALSKNSLSLIRDTTDMQRRAIKQAIATSILEGLQGDAIRSRILASGLHNIEHWPSVEYRAGVIARTETMRAFNEGNIASIQSSGARFVRWIASPDEAVCSICAPRNEQVYRLGAADAPTGKFQEPRFDDPAPLVGSRGYGKPPNFSPAANDQEITDRMRKTGLFAKPPKEFEGKEGFFSHLSTGERNEILAQMEWLQAQGYRAQITSTGPNADDNPANTLGRRIEITSPTKTRFSHDIAETFRHEYFHVLESDMGISISNSQEAAISDKIRPWLDEAFKGMGVSNVRDDRVGAYVSSYAKTGLAEFFAEYGSMVSAPGYARGTLPGDSSFLDMLGQNGMLSSPPGASIGDPYPHALPLPKLPAHPRCRCTVRAEFRGPDGQVLRGAQNPPEKPPTIPSGLMGGDQPAKPPTPSAAGDFDKALGDLNRSFGGERLTDWRRIRGALSQVTDAEQRRKLLGAFGHDEASWAELESKLGVSFWRNLGRIEEADIQKIARFGKTATSANTTLANFLEARYGIGFKAKPGWTPELRAATIRALERIRELNPSYVTDSIYLRLIGDRPYGAKNFKGGVIARAFASGEVEGNMKTWAEFTKPGATLRAGAGVDAAEEVIIHEYFHTIHSRFGLHDTDMVSRLGGGRINPFKAIEAVDRAWHEEYEAIRRQSHGIAPDEAAVTKLEERIRQYQGYVDDPTRQYARGYNEGIVTRYTRELQELRDALNGQVTHEWNPTEYAVRGGYAEDFAESGMLYMLNPARLKKYSPLRYEFFKQRVFGGQEAR